MNPILLVVPGFLVFAFIEYTVARKRNLLGNRKFENSISNISVGIAERMLNLFITGAFYNLYVYLHDHFRLFDIGSDWYVWVLLLLFTDFVWYWYHRFGHEINIMWGAHVVHHQSEEYNYTVSARITTLQALIRNLFWAILPIVGFDPLMVTAILVVHGAYSFFTHTEVIGRLGWIEKILVTPSHHRVHHAANDQYLNKNYSDIFIFWDKLFGTFQEEKEKPVYGLTHPLNSHSFLWQHFHFYLELLESCRRSKGFVSRLRILFGRPEAIDAGIRDTLERRMLKRNRFKVKTRRFRFYLVIQVVASLAILTLFSIHFNNLDPVSRILIVAITLLTLVNCGALIEQQTWLFGLEIARAFVISAYVSYWMENIWALLVLSMIIMLIWLSERAERIYFQAIYQMEDAEL